MYLINHDPQMMLGFSQQLHIFCNINIEKKEYSINSEVKNILSNFSLHNETNSFYTYRN